MLNDKNIKTRLINLKEINSSEKMWYFPSSWRSKWRSDPWFNPYSFLCNIKNIWGGSRLRKNGIRIPPGRFFWAKTNNEKKFRIGICYCLKEPDLGFNQNKSFLTEACLKIDTGLLLTGIIGWCIFRPTLIRYTPLLTYSKIRYTTHPTY